MSDLQASTQSKMMTNSNTDNNNKKKIVIVGGGDLALGFCNMYECYNHDNGEYELVVSMHCACIAYSTL